MATRNRLKAASELWLNHRAGLLTHHNQTADKTDPGATHLLRILRSETAHEYGSSGVREQYKVPNTLPKKWKGTGENRSTED